MKKVNIAKNTTEFLDTVSSAIVKTMNTTEIGQELTEKLLEMKLAENPNMTKEEWNKTKQQFLIFMFHSFIKETPQAMQELGEHIYNELNAE
jgi:hypothetical protein